METFQIKITATQADPASLVKAIRTIGCVGLPAASKLAKYLTNHGSTVLLAGVSRAVAEAAADLVAQAGAGAVLEPSTLEAPMLLAPEAGYIHTWSRIRGPVRKAR